MNDVTNASSTHGAAEQKAVGLARASAWALWLAAAFSVFNLVQLWLNRAAAQAIMAAEVKASVADQPPEAAAMAQTMVESGPMIALVIGGTLVLAQVLLGVWQWRRPGVVIPIIFVLLTGFGVVEGLLEIPSFATVAAEAGVLKPLWQMWLGLVVVVTCAVLHVLGLLGAVRLGKLRKA